MASTQQVAELNCYHAHSEMNSASKKNFIKEHALPKVRCNWGINTNDGLLECYNKDKLTKCLAARVIKVQRRPRSNILIVECGPGEFGMIFFLEFDSSNEADEWHKELCKITGQKYKPSNPSLVKRSQTDRWSKKPKHPMRVVSSFPDIYPENMTPSGESVEGAGESDASSETEEQDEVESTDEHASQMVQPMSDNADQNNNDCTSNGYWSRSTQSNANLPEEADNDEIAISHTPVNSDRTPVEPPSPGASSTGGEEISTFLSTPVFLTNDRPSPTLSLRSNIESTLSEYSLLLYERDMESVVNEFDVSHLRGMKLSLTDYKNKVYVTNFAVRACDLNMYDVIEISSENERKMDAREVIEYILNCTEEKICLKVQRFPEGMVCRVNVSHFNELGITLQENEIVQMSATDAVRQVCDPLTVSHEGVRSLRSITTVNNEPVPFGTKTDEVYKLLFDVISKEGDWLVLHLHPTTFIKAVAAASSWPPDDDPIFPINSMESGVSDHEDRNKESTEETAEETRL